MQKYNIVAYNGDTYPGCSFQINVNDTPLDLTGAAIEMHVRKTRDSDAVLDLDLDSGLTIIDDANGEFKINEQIISIAEPGGYIYDIEITLADGTVKTYIQGDFVIIGDITHG